MSLFDNLDDATKQSLLTISHGSKHNIYEIAEKLRESIMPSDSDLELTEETCGLLGDLMDIVPPDTIEAYPDTFTYQVSEVVAEGLTLSDSIYESIVQHLEKILQDAFDRVYTLSTGIGPIIMSVHRTVEGIISLGYQYLEQSFDFITIGIIGGIKTMLLTFNEVGVSYAGLIGDGVYAGIHYALDFAITKICQGKGYMSAFSDILASIRDAYQKGVYNASGVIATIQEYSTTLTKDMITSLLRCAQNGVYAVVNYVENFISQIWTQANDEGDQAFLTSGAVEFQTFSWGIIGTTIGTIATIAGAVIYAVAPVVGIIVSLAGAITTGIFKMIDAYVLNKSSTFFSIDGKDPVHCFDLCVDRGVIYDTDLFNSLVERGYYTGTLYPRTCPVLIFVNVNDPSDSSKGVTYEAYLSCDYDISQYLYISNIESSDQSSPACLSWLLDGNSLLKFKNGNLQNLPNYHGVRSAVFWRKDILNSNNRNIVMYGYDPLDIRALDSVLTTESMNNTLKIRFISSLLLYCIFTEEMIFRYDATLHSTAITESADFDYYALCVPNFNYSQYTGDFNENTNANSSNFSVYFLVNLFRLSQEIVADVLEDGMLVSNSNFDAILLKVKSLFNGLPGSQYTYGSQVTVPQVTMYIVDYQKSATGNPGFELGSIIGSSTIRDHYNLCTVCHAHFVGAINYYYTEQNNSYYPDTLNIHLPSSLFSAYISGVIISGFTIVLAAVAATALIVAKKKMNQRRVRKQIAMESAWYSAQSDYVQEVDETTGQATYRAKTQADRDNDWKNYKKARRSYNIYAMLTGSSRVPLGLGDDSADNGGISNLLSGLSSYKAIDGEPENLVGTVYQSIVGAK